MTTSSAGWYSDPTGRYLYRYWNGGQWTDQVSTGGSNSGIDPGPLDPAVATTPPAPGSAAPVAAAAAPQPAVQVTTTQSRSPVGAIVAGVLAVIAIIAIVAVLANSGDDSETTPTDPPATQPTETTASSE